MTGQGLLGDNVERVALASSQGRRQARVELGLVRVIRASRGVVLGHNRNIVRAQSEVGKRVSESRIASTACRRQSAEAGGGDRGVCAVREGTCVGDNRLDRQAQIRGDITAGHQQGATTSGLEEARTTTISSAREVTRGNSAGLKRGRLSGRVHVAETGQRLDRNIVDTTGNNEVGLAQANLVDSLLDGNRCGRASTHRVDHLTVAANEGLHGVCGHNIGQGLLKDVLRTILTQEAREEDMAQGLHATNTRALRRGHIRGVDGLQELSGGEARGDEGIHCGDEVPYGDAVQGLDHGSGDTPLSRIEVLRDLATNRAGQGCSRGDLDGGTSGLGDVPGAVFFPDRRVRGIGQDVVFGFSLRIHGEGLLGGQEDRPHIIRTAINHVRIVVEAADTRSSHDLIAEPIVDLGLVNLRTRGVIPTRLRAFGPGDELHHPGHFQHAGCGQIEVFAELSLLAGTTRTPGTDLAGADDDNLIAQAHSRSIPRERSSQSRSMRVGQCANACRGLFCGFLCRGRGLLACLACQCRQVESSIGEAAREIGVDRGGKRLLTDLASQELSEFSGNFFGRVDVNTGCLSGGNEDIVAAHERGALDPTDERVSDGCARRPTGLVLPLGCDRIESGLRFAVGTVTTEDSSVRGTREQDVRAVIGSSVRAEAGEEVNCALDAPQKQALLSERTLRIRTNGSGNARRCEGNEKIGQKRRLDDLGRCTVRFGLFATHP